MVTGRKRIAVAVLRAAVVISLIVFSVQHLDSQNTPKLTIIDGHSSSTNSLNTSINSIVGYAFRPDPATALILGSSASNSSMSMSVTGWLEYIGNNQTGFYRIYINISVTGALYKAVRPGSISFSATTNGTNNEPSIDVMQLLSAFYNEPYAQYFYHTGAENLSYSVSSADNFGIGGYGHASLAMQFTNRSGGAELYNFSFNTQLEILLGIFPGGNYDIALNFTMVGLNSPVSDSVNIVFHQANASIASVLVHPEQLVGYVRSGSGCNSGEGIVMKSGGLQDFFPVAGAVIACSRQGG